MGLWSQLFGRGEAPRDLLADLSEDYRAEAAQAALLRAHAERARYPQAASALRRLADIEVRHASWLADRLVALGAELPEVAATPVAGNNPWQRAVAAYSDAQAKRRRLIEQITHWDPEQPEAVELLHRIADEDLREQAAYESLIMRSDPQALD